MPAHAVGREGGADDDVEPRVVRLADCRGPRLRVKLQRCAQFLGDFEDRLEVTVVEGHVPQLKTRAPLNPKVVTARLSSSVAAFGDRGRAFARCLCDPFQRCCRR